MVLAPLKDRYDVTEAALLISLAAIGWAGFSRSRCLRNCVTPFLPKTITATVYTQARLVQHRLELNHYTDKNIQKNDVKFMKQLHYRLSGAFHAIIATILALGISIFDANLIRDPINGVSRLWQITGCFVSGYFLWDILAVFWSFDFRSGDAQWILHGSISLLAMASTFFASRAPMCYYASQFLFLETSTIFLSFRWFAITALKSGSLKDRTEDRQNIQAYLDRCSILFAVSFGVVRMLWAPVYLYYPLMQIFFTHPSIQEMGRLRWSLFITAIPAFAALNIYWFAQILITWLRKQGKTAEIPLS